VWVASVSASSVGMVRDHFADRFFLSVTGIARHRILTDVDKAVSLVLADGLSPQQAEQLWANDVDVRIVRSF
jgi:hypothetical protein